MTKSQKIAYYILLVIVSAIFIVASFSKLIAEPAAVAGFAVAHLPIWFMYCIGIAEIAGVIGLWMQSPKFIKLRTLATGGLFIILVGAVVTTAVFVNIPEAIFPLIVAILLGFIVKLDKKRVAAVALSAPVALPISTDTISENQR